MGPRCSSAETQVCHRSYIIAASYYGPYRQKYGIDIQIVRPEMTKFKMFREKVNMYFYLWELHSKILVGDKNLL
jgi:hypothetical protein